MLQVKAALQQESASPAAAEQTTDAPTPALQAKPTAEDAPQELQPQARAQLAQQGSRPQQKDASRRAAAAPIASVQLPSASTAVTGPAAASQAGPRQRMPRVAVPQPPGLDVAAILQQFGVVEDRSAPCQAPEHSR